jgi:hypothetical protein
MTPLADALVAFRADLARWRARAWAFVAECGWTYDEADLAHPIKPFPVAACVPCRRYVGHEDTARCPDCGGTPRPLRYLEHVADAWQALGTGERPPVLYVPKPRRMKFTWLFAHLHTWLALFHAGAGIFLVSSKEAKSGELIDRCEFIVDHLPWPVKPEVKRSGPKPHYQSPALIFPRLGSKILGIAEGPDQLRQFGASAILFDEFGTWDYPRATFAAAKPCILGGGRLAIVSSAYPGTWRAMCDGDFSA